MLNCKNNVLLKRCYCVGQNIHNYTKKIIPDNIIVVYTFKSKLFYIIHSRVLRQSFFHYKMLGANLSVNKFNYGYIFFVFCNKVY